MWEVRSRKKSRLIAGSDSGDWVIPFTEWRTPKRSHLFVGAETLEEPSFIQHLLYARH